MLLFLLLTLSNTIRSQSIPKDIKSHQNWKQLDAVSEICGHSVVNRIVGGEIASLGQYPWIARLGYSNSLTGKFIFAECYDCAGVIITENYILTAAHCSSDELKRTLVEVRLGEYDTSQDKDCEGTVCSSVQDIEVKAEICHDDFKSGDFRHDICLLLLEESIFFNDYVKPICMPVYDVFQDNNFEGETMEVAGWGKSDRGVKNDTTANLCWDEGQYFEEPGEARYLNRVEKNEQDVLTPSTLLLTVKLPVVPKNECIIEDKKVYTEQICAGGVIGKDACNGDSGGPLMLPYSVNSPPKYFVIGIVSYGLTICGKTSIPGVYTLVPKYLNWILDNINDPFNM